MSGGQCALPDRLPPLATLAHVRSGEQTFGPHRRQVADGGWQLSRFPSARKSARSGCGSLWGLAASGCWHGRRPASSRVKADRCSGDRAEGFEIQPLTGLPTAEAGTFPEDAFPAIAVTPAGLKRHGSVLIERATVLALDHRKADPLHSVAAGFQGPATSRCRLPWLRMRSQQMLHGPGIPACQREGAVARSHQLLGRSGLLLARNQGSAAAHVGAAAARAGCGRRRGGSSAKAQWREWGGGHGFGAGNPFCCTAD